MTSDQCVAVPASLDGAAAIRELVCGYAASDRQRKLLVALQAFVDDSASDVADRRLFLAGYVANAETWMSFSDAWADALKRSPAIDYFKMAEAQNLGGQFRGWSERERDLKVARLAGIIRRQELFSLHCSVSRSEYEEILAPVAPYQLKNPFFMCFWGIMDALARYRSSNGADDGPVDFIFDEQGGLGADAVLWYRWLKESKEPNIRAQMGSTPIFRDDKRVVALQAADMLAWHMRRRHENKDERRPILGALLHEHIYLDCDSEMLAKSACFFRKTPAASLVPDRAAWRRSKAALRTHVDADLPAPSINYFRLQLLTYAHRAGELARRMERWWRKRR